MIFKYVLPILAIVGFGVAAVIVLEGNRTPPVVQPQSAPVNSPFTSYVYGTGIVEASTENIAIGTPASGIVTAIYVKWNDQVKKGDPLFKIDDRDLQAQLPLAMARVKEAEANLAKQKHRLSVGERLEPNVSISAEEMANRRFDVGINDAALASANAQVEQIKSEINRRTIRALVSGRILQIKTRLGEFAQSGAVTPLMLLGDDTRLHLRVEVDENDAWRVQPCAPAVAFFRGNPEVKTPVHYERTEPDVVPKALLTGDSTQRTDTRVLQVIYSFDHAAMPAYVGQQMDVFIETPAVDASKPGTQPAPNPCANRASANSHASAKRGKS
jgi:HlyD family secretion protein